MKHIQLAKFISGPLFALSAMALAGGIAFAVTPPSLGSVEPEIRVDINSKIRLGLIPDVPGATGEAVLEVRDVEGGFELRGRADIDGLHPDHHFSLCLNGMFIGSAVTDDQGSAQIDETIMISPHGHDSLEVTVHAGLGCEGAVVLH